LQAQVDAERQHRAEDQVEREIPRERATVGHGATVSERTAITPLRK
jgi:hypothetical protein